MNRIKAVLQEKNHNQKWLAEKLGKSYNMVNSYAQNRRQPSVEDLYRIAEILEMEAKELLLEHKDKKFFALFVHW
ncbi:helix-turn-helix transcriptional regulator [Salinimicrobium sp. TIG7-5_MAKvit]|uniref:helix-turn-helix domain-containing protein n=1 Tax=Salinimicrobium sp. TIG7-5_MAKvit TaxID=3121289 RepID=UPI003C6E679A